MYLWNTASPYRDGDMEAGIVIHELTHGLSTRLTGGPLNSGCLGWGEAGGMGEGWGGTFLQFCYPDTLMTRIRLYRHCYTLDGGILGLPHGRLGIEP